VSLPTRSRDAALALLLTSPPPGAAVAGGYLLPPRGRECIGVLRRAAAGSPCGAGVVAARWSSWWPAGGARALERPVAALGSSAVALLLWLRIPFNSKMASRHLHRQGCEGRNKQGKLQRVTLHAVRKLQWLLDLSTSLFIWVQCKDLKMGFLIHTCLFILGLIQSSDIGHINGHIFYCTLTG
jgi:hypothetical protein